MSDRSQQIGYLRKDRDRIAAELDDLEKGQRGSEERREGSPFGKREEEADEFSELEKRAALEERLKEVLAEIDHTLQKYAAGTYGVCDVCRKPIEPARLEALPHASLCLSCKAKQGKDARPRPR